MTELKPCPFCGGEAELRYGRSGDTYSFVRCTRCFSRVAECYISTEYSCDEKAIEAWNRRAGDGNG